MLSYATNPKKRSPILAAVLSALVLLSTPGLSWSGPATITEGSFSNKSHNFWDFLTPLTSGLYVPYHRLAGSPTSRDHTWRSVVLENDYVSITVLPDLGGRILKFVNKTTGNNQFYENTAGFKNNPWGRLNWWIATGGTEFMIPWDEHGVSFYPPFTNYPSPAGYLIEDLEGFVRLTMRFRELNYIGIQRWLLNLEIVLPDNSATYEIRHHITNESTQHEWFQYWTNTMASPGGTMTIRPSTANLNQQIIFPEHVNQLYDHNGMESFLGGAWKKFNWPVHNFRTIDNIERWMQTYRMSASGMFIPSNFQNVTFQGLYNVTANEGLARVFPSEIIPGIRSGVKFWHWGTYAETGSYAFSDGNTTYAELMGGPITVFEEGPYPASSHPTGEPYRYAMAPGQIIQYSEYFMAPEGIGTFVHATKDVALNFQTPASAVLGTYPAITIGVYTASPQMGGAVSLKVNGYEFWRKDNLNTAPNASPGPYYEVVSPYLCVPSFGTSVISLTYEFPEGGTATTSRTISLSGTCGFDTPTMTITPTFTLTPTFTITNTPTRTNTPTLTFTPSQTPTPTPIGPDFDGDGIADVLEGGKNAGMIGKSNMYLYDSDGDGLYDGIEDLNRNGVRDTGETSAIERDSDEDGYEDGIEVLVLDSNPLNPASPVAAFVDADGDALPDSIDPNPAEPDTDGDRFLDGYEAAILGIGAVTNANQRPSLGDVDHNGFRDNADAQKTLNFFANVSQIGFDPNRSDTNRDVVIDNADAQRMLMFFAQIIPYYPVE